MNRLQKFLNPVCCFSLAATTAIFSFVPESVFTHGFVCVNYPVECIVIINRILWFLGITLLSCVVVWGYRLFRNKVTITGNNYKIVVEYGDIFEKESYIKVINFDECYSTKIGTSPSDIKADSICGQFLTRFPDVDVVGLINSAGLKTSRKLSNFQNNKCYESGSVAPYENYLLLAFAKLDKDGLGRLTREEFLQCLNKLWKEIDKYYCGKSVAIPILGSGITRFNETTLTKQQLLDIIIASYKLCPDKMKKPAELHIICVKDDEFSLDKIGEYV